MPSKTRFVGPDITRIPLSQGDWIEIKERLSFSEARRLQGAMLRSVKRGEDDEPSELGIDWSRYSVLRLETFLVNWSFVTANDTPVVLSRASIENLDPETAAEIEAALDAHLTEQAAKKGATTPTVTTSSS